MSHRALVAVPTSNNTPTYDVYKSRNGAENFKLHPILDSLSDQDLSTLQKLPYRPPEGFNVQEYAEKFNSNIEHPRPDEPIVQKDPIHTNITIDELIQNTNYVLYDALYVVKGSKVTTYYLSWMGEMMQSLLAANGTLEVYPAKARDPNTVEGTDPYYRINGDTFLDLSEATKIRQDAPPIDVVEEVLAESHMGIFRNINHSLTSPGPDINPSLTIADLTLVYKPNNQSDFKALRMVAQFGVCIKAEIKDIPPDIVWTDLHKRANPLRWYHMKEVNGYVLDKNEAETRKEMEQSAEDFEDKNRIEFGTVRPNLP